VVQYGSRGIRERIILEKATYESSLLPGFELPLAQLLEAADREAEAEKLPKERPR
jgi:hypothetical protein